MENNTRSFFIASSRWRRHLDAIGEKFAHLQTDKFQDELKRRKRKNCDAHANYN